MTKINDGGPAFPRPMSQQTNAGGEVITIDNGDPGMTLRDHFAGQALAGHMAKIYVGEKETELEAARLAKMAYRTADAMLRERSK